MKLLNIVYSVYFQIDSHFHPDDTMVCVFVKRLSAGGEVHFTMLPLCLCDLDTFAAEIH